MALTKIPPSGINTEALGEVLGGGGAQEDVFYENSQTLTTSYTITTGKSAVTVGPLTIANGAAVTVPTGSRWVIL